MARPLRAHEKREQRHASGKRRAQRIQRGLDPATAMRLPVAIPLPRSEAPADALRRADGC
jgi:hypothetical protein